MSTRRKPETAPGDVDPMGGFVVSRVIVAGNLLRRGAARRYARMLQLSSVEFGIVAMLGDDKPTPVRTLASLLGMDKAQLSRALSALTRRGLIERSPGASDQRDVLVSLTPGGKAAHAALLDSAARVNERLLDGWSREDRDTLDGLLSRITARARVLLAEEVEAGQDQAPKR